MISDYKIEFIFSSPWSPDFVDILCAEYGSYSGSNASFDQGFTDHVTSGHKSRWYEGDAVIVRESLARAFAPVLPVFIAISPISNPGATAPDTPPL